MYFGTINYEENWSAYAPDFKELDENEEYEEREDEFDIIPEEELKHRKQEEENEVVDLVAPIKHLYDSDDMVVLPLLGIGVGQ